MGGLAPTVARGFGGQDGGTGRVKRHLVTKCLGIRRSRLRSLVSDEPASAVRGLSRLRQPVCDGPATPSQGAYRNFLILKIFSLSPGMDRGEISIDKTMNIWILCGCSSNTRSGYEWPSKEGGTLFSISLFARGSTPARTTSYKPDRKHVRRGANTNKKHVRVTVHKSETEPVSSSIPRIDWDVRRRFTNKKKF